MNEQEPFWIPDSDIVPVKRKGGSSKNEPGSDRVKHSHMLRQSFAKAVQASVSTIASLSNSFSAASNVLSPKRLLSSISPSGMVASLLSDRESFRQAGLMSVPITIGYGRDVRAHPREGQPRVSKIDRVAERGHRSCPQSRNVGPLGGPVEGGERRR